MKCNFLQNGDATFSKNACNFFQKRLAQNTSSEPQKCRVSAFKPGTAIFKGTTIDGGYSCECDIIVVDHAVQAVVLNNNNISVAENDTVALTATVLPKNADNQDVIWSSLDENIFTVNQEGVITAIHAGTATVTATTDESGYTATCTVTVTHNWNEEYTVDTEPTCTEEGSESIHCSVCDEIDATTVRAIPKSDHAYGDWTVIKEVTCTENGSKT